MENCGDGVWVRPVAREEAGGEAATKAIAAAADIRMTAGVIRACEKKLFRVN